MADVRLMREDDADAVRELDADAFFVWEKQVKGERALRYLRTRDNILLCREHDPQGCFVAEEEGRTVGFIFSRTWGGVGWFGTFGVLPQYQGRGIGRELIAASMEYLRKDPSRVIGLETMAESPYNLGLYLRLGFEIRPATVMLSRNLQNADVAHEGLLLWSTADSESRSRWLADLRTATAGVVPGLDYTKEIVSTDRRALGETLVMVANGVAVGMSTVWTVSACEEWGHDRASIKALVLHPDHTTGASLSALMGASEDLGRLRGKTTLSVALSARHAWALKQLLDRGYRVRGMAVRMTVRAEVINVFDHPDSTFAGPRTA